MDPSVQVALITIVTTAITTGGVVYVGRSGTNKERKKAAEAGVEEGLSETNANETIAYQAREISRKESTISRLRADKAELERNKAELTEDLADAQREITRLESEVQWLKDQLTQRRNP